MDPISRTTLFPAWLLRADPRTTGAGRFLRSTTPLLSNQPSPKVACSGSYNICDEKRQTQSVRWDVLFHCGILITPDRLLTIVSWRNQAWVLKKSVMGMSFRLR
jgi:hypothetical protein